MNFIAEARERRGISQAELAKELGVSTGTVAGWELLPHGEYGHKFRLSRLSSVAKALRVKKADLLAWWLEMAA